MRAANTRVPGPARAAGRRRRSDPEHAPFAVRIDHGVSPRVHGHVSTDRGRGHAGSGADRCALGMGGKWPRAAVSATPERPIRTAHRSAPELARRSTRSVDSGSSPRLMARESMRAANTDDGVAKVRPRARSIRGAHRSRRQPACPRPRRYHPGAWPRSLGRESMRAGNTRAPRHSRGRARAARSGAARIRSASARAAQPGSGRSCSPV
jgi:hypothetical protein